MTHSIVPVVVLYLIILLSVKKNVLFLSVTHSVPEPASRVPENSRGEFLALNNAFTLFDKDREMYGYLYTFTISTPP